MNGYKNNINNSNLSNNDIIHVKKINSDYYNGLASTYLQNLKNSRSSLQNQIDNITYAYNQTISGIIVINGINGQSCIFNQPTLTQLPYYYNPYIIDNITLSGLISYHNLNFYIPQPLGAVFEEVLAQSIPYGSTAYATDAQSYDLSSNSMIHHLLIGIPEGKPGKDGSSFDPETFIELQSTVFILQGEVSVLQGQVASIEAQLLVIDATLATIEGEITVIEGEITTINEQIATLQGDITTINEEITNINTNIETLDTKTQNQTATTTATTFNHNLNVSDSLTVTNNTTSNNLTVSNNATIHNLTCSNDTILNNVSINNLELSAISLDHIYTNNIHSEFIKNPFATNVINIGDGSTTIILNGYVKFINTSNNLTDTYFSEFINQL